MKGKLERWFSKAWDLETVSLFTLASGFKQKNYKVFTIETKSSSKKSKSSILATHRVRIWSSSFVFTFLVSSLNRIYFSRWSALIAENLKKICYIFNSTHKISYTYNITRWTNGKIQSAASTVSIKSLWILL